MQLSVPTTIKPISLHQSTAFFARPSSIVNAPTGLQRRFVSHQAIKQKNKQQQNSSNQKPLNKKPLFYAAGVTSLVAIVTWDDVKKYIAGGYDRKAKIIETTIKQKQQDLNAEINKIEDYLKALPSDVSPLTFKKKLHLYNDAQDIGNVLSEVGKKINETKDKVQQIKNQFAQELSGANEVITQLAWLQKEKEIVESRLEDGLSILQYLAHMNNAYLTLIKQDKPNVDNIINDAVNIIFSKPDNFSLLGVSCGELRANAYNLQAKARRKTNDFQGARLSYEAGLRHHPTDMLHSNLGASLIDTAYQHIPTPEAIAICSKTQQCEEVVAVMLEKAQQGVKQHEQATFFNGSPNPDTTEMKWWSNSLRSKNLQILTDYAWGLRVQVCATLLAYEGQTIPPSVLQECHNNRKRAHDILDRVIQTLEDPSQVTRKNEVNAVQPHMFKGVLHMDESNLAEAKKQFDHVLKLNPEHPQAKKRLALLQEKTGKINDWTTESCCVRLTR